MDKHKFWCAVLSAMILVGALNFPIGCSSVLPTETIPQRVSDVGELVAVHEYLDGTVQEFEYNGVIYWGDILLSEVEGALSIVSPGFVEFEVLERVLDYRKFPESLLNPTMPNDVFRLTTCTTDPLLSCDRGRFYNMKESSSSIVIDSSGIWVY